MAKDNQREKNKKNIGFYLVQLTDVVINDRIRRILFEMSSQFTDNHLPPFNTFAIHNSNLIQTFNHQNKLMLKALQPGQLFP